MCSRDFTGIPRSAFRAPRLTRASVLVGLLWCVALLSLVVISVLHTARMDLMVGKNSNDRIQARYLALAGIEKARALLYHNARERSRSGKNHSGELYNAPDQFRDVALGRGEFRVIRRAQPDEGNGIAYGVSDEESRININTVDAAILEKIEGLSPQIRAAILDWRDADNAASPGGAESEYYLSLQPPRLPRNGPFQTMRELLMVRGVSPALLLGDDTRQNGLLDPEWENPAGSRITGASMGLAGMLTVDSSVRNVNAAGNERVNIQTADEAALTGVHGITPAIARAITAYRRQNRFQSIVDLLDVTRPQNNPNQNRPQGNPPPGQNNDPAANDDSGPRVIDENLLLDIADDVTTASEQDQDGLINVNTASQEVLACLPGMDRDLARAITSHRQSGGFFQNIAGLLKVPGMSPRLLKQLAPVICTRSETFRILGEGRVPSSGTHLRVQVVVRVGLNSITTLSYREDDL
jgi:DNA uptake protein ComE-like DNA-binding protein